MTKTDSSGNVVYYHTDGLGSVTVLTSTTGALLEQYTYDIYGAATITNASGAPLTSSAYGNRFMFTGREYLASLNLYDYRNRFYSAQLGRFLQPDPISFTGDPYNLYRYASNNSVNNTDPTGLWQCTIYGGSFLGGYLTIGNNGPGTTLSNPFGGQWNIGIKGGIAAGCAVGLDLNNTGIVPSGFGWGETIAAAAGNGIAGVGGQLTGDSNQGNSFELEGRYWLGTAGVGVGDGNGGILNSPYMAGGGGNYGAAAFAGEGITWASNNYDSIGGGGGAALNDGSGAYGVSSDGVSSFDTSNPFDGPSNFSLSTGANTGNIGMTSSGAPGPAPAPAASSGNNGGSGDDDDDDDDGGGC